MLRQGCHVLNIITLYSPVTEVEMSTLKVKWSRVHQEASFYVSPLARVRNAHLTRCDVCALNRDIRLPRTDSNLNSRPITYQPLGSHAAPRVVEMGFYGSDGRGTWPIRGDSGSLRTWKQHKPGMYTQGQLYVTRSLASFLVRKETESLKHPEKHLASKKCPPNLSGL